jgi:hypothetical protein
MTIREEGETMDRSELNGHIDNAEECIDYLQCEADEGGDMSGRMHDFAVSLRIVTTQLAALEKERDHWSQQTEHWRGETSRYYSALVHISEIRDNIVGMQGFNLSEHAYPLVAILDGLGIKGAGYEIARENLGTLIEQRNKAEAERDQMRAVCEAAIAWRATSPGQPANPNSISGRLEVAIDTLSTLNKTKGAGE